MKFFLIFLILIGFAGWAHADDSLFEYEIFPVNLEVNNIELRNVFDWTSDGKILFSAKLEDDTETLILVSADGKIIKQLDISSVDNPPFPTIHAQIDPTDDNIVHFLKNDKLYRYLLDKDRITQLNTNGYKVGFFDYYPYSEDDPAKHMIAYSVEGQSSPYKVQLFSMHDSHEEELEDTVSELLSNLEHMIFQFSSDGKKILFKQTLTTSYGQADRRIAYLGAQDYGPHVVTDLNIRCGNYPKWHPAGDLIVYHISYCGRSAPGGVLGIISMDGSKHQVLLPDNNDNPANFAISRDGSAIAILPLTNGKSYGEIADFYMLNLQSMSEDRAIFPRHGNPPDSFTPLQHERNGTPINQIQCRNENHVLIQKYDGSPACVKPETKEKLIERGWANINTDNIRQTVSLPSPPDPMSIAITGNDKLPIFTIKRGETKEIGILFEPKIPITFATVSVDSYFGSAGDCNNISTDSYCPGRGIIMNLSETEITAKKEITLTITIPENMTVGTYGYQIETKTTFDMSSFEKPRTIGNSVRFDLKVI